MKAAVIIIIMVLILGCIIGGIVYYLHQSSIAMSPKKSPSSSSTPQTQSNSGSATGSGTQQHTTTQQTPPCPSIYYVQANDTLDTISQRFGVQVNSLVNWNNIQDASVIGLHQPICLVAPGTTTPFSSSVCKGVHTVGAGDTIDSIATLYSVDPNYLAQVNNIQDINVISSGQLLCIPSASSFFQSLANSL